MLDMWCFCDLRASQLPVKLLLVILKPREKEAAASVVSSLIAAWNWLLKLP